MEDTPRGLPPAYEEHWRTHAEAIRSRLAEFRSVRTEEYIWELFYCLLTPQSRASNAELAVERLRGARFLERRFDPSPILRDPLHYIRFHNQKARRLLEAADAEASILAMLVDPALDAPSRREWLVGNVGGLGWKEASHVLRNIGHLELAIIDRHILKHMVRLGALTAVPKSIGTRRAYFELESSFADLARRFGLRLQELDLLIWSLEEGSVRK